MKLIDADALSAYLDERLPGEGPFEVERHRAGHSNETFFIRREGHAWVLRRPPSGAFLPTAHDVLREHRVLEALAHLPVRTPRPLLACEDPAVIGAPFFVMEKVEGMVVRDELPDGLDPRRIGEELVDALVELHAVDWRAAGLGDWGRPTGYLERQLRRWRGQLDLTLPMTRPLPDLERIHVWLEANLPVSPTATIVHGDYKLDNVMFDAGTRLVAILDWEMATIGDPLADLGWMLSFWRTDGAVELASVTNVPGFAPREEVIARYEERTGRAAAGIGWYEVLAIWKLAILLEGSYARHLAGMTDDPFFADMEHAVPELGRRALEVSRRG